MGNKCCRQAEVLDTSYELTIHIPQHRYINRGKLVEESKISRSTYKMYDTILQKEVTCKKIKITKRLRAKREVNILQQLNSPFFFPEFSDFSEDEEFYNIYYSFIPGVDLFTYLFKNIDKTSVKEIKIFIKKMLDCLIELRRKNLCHLDIKFENYIFNKDENKVILIDFESAHSYPKTNALKTLSTYVGTKSYIAPEIWLNYYHRNSDVWSVAVCLWTALTLQYPFGVSKLTKHTDNLETKIRRKYLFPKVRHDILMDELNFNDDLKDFFNKAFYYSPSKRMTLQQMVNHNWLKLST